jgi:hypothetical protein
MKPYRSIVLACSLVACAERWDGGGRRQELPSDERMQEATSGGAPADGGAGLAGSPPDENAGASVGGNGGNGGNGGVIGLGPQASAGTFAGIGTAGTSGTAGTAFSP